ncbi:hypothetical protein Tco_0687254 [Tanacetum coccineum]
MGVNILQLIDESPFMMGKFRETVAEGALHLGPKRDRVFADLAPEEKERFKADIRATNILLQGLPKDIYTLINHYTDAKYIWDNIKMLLEGSELTKDERESQLYDEFEHFRQNKGETIHEYYDQLYAYMKQHKAHANANKMMLERYTHTSVDPLALMSNVSPHQYPSQSFANPQSAYVPPGRQNKGQGNYAKGAVAARKRGVHNRVGNVNPGGQTNMFDDDVDAAPVQDLALNKDNVFQADQCDAFDSDVDEAPTAQTMFMENLSSANPIYDEASPSYDSDILSEVQDHDNYLDSVGKYHDVQEMQNDVQPNYIVDSYVEYTSDSNIILYAQYVKDNAVQAAQCVSTNKQTKVVNESLTAELARYKEQVELYEKRARFELTEREQKIDKQLRIIITDRNNKEESLKKGTSFCKNAT